MYAIVPNNTMREKVEREGVGKRRAGGVHRGYIHRLDSEATTFYFTNFPEDVKAIDLWPRFGRFARVGEVYIPNKVDKQGNRFGFVKFREVNDAVDLLRRVSNIWIGSFKLRVNLSKFKRNEEPDKKEGVQRVKLGVNPRAQEGRSFKQALVTKEVVSNADPGECSKAREAMISEGVKEVVWEVEVEEERAAMLTGAYVGYLTEEKEAKSIQNNFIMSGFQGLRVAAMGFKQVLLWSEKVGEVKEVIESVGWWCSLFERVVPWSPELVSNQRVTWLRCYGVPTHAWGVDLFRALAFKHGRFIEVDESTKLFQRCDVARVKVVTNKTHAIDSFMPVQVNGRRFDIRIMEELSDTQLSGGEMIKVAPGWQEDQSSLLWCRFKVCGGAGRVFGVR
jgi:hypothetical protein